MILERDPGKMAKLQAEAISDFFGVNIPKPESWLFNVIRDNRKEKLFDVDKLCPFYVPKRELIQGMSYPGLKRPLDSWFYQEIKAENIANNAGWLQEGWILLDLTERPNYDSGKQMYPDTPRFKEMLFDLREKGYIEGADSNNRVPKDSRFDISPDDIDGKRAFVAKAVSSILSLYRTKQVTIPLYSVFNYIGNLCCEHFGQADTFEWFRDIYKNMYRLAGGRSTGGGLSYIDHCDMWAGAGQEHIGFRLQISSPEYVLLHNQ